MFCLFAIVCNFCVFLAYVYMFIALKIYAVRRSTLEGSVPAHSCVVFLAAPKRAGMFNLTMLVGYYVAFFLYTNIPRNGCFLDSDCAYKITDVGTGQKSSGQSYPSDIP